MPRARTRLRYLRRQQKLLEKKVRSGTTLILGADAQGSAKYKHELGEAEKKEGRPFGTIGDHVHANPLAMEYASF